MRSSLFFFLFFFSSYTLYVQAQNLVPNPSFEDFDNCPAFYLDLTPPSAPTFSVRRWHTASGATPDYFNPCSVLFDVPLSEFGYQFPRTGNSYMGAYSKQEDMYVPEYREYIEARLQAPLVAGHRYYVSYWLSLSGGSPGFAGRTYCGLDQMGAYFSVNAEERTGSGLPFDDLIPQIKSPLGVTFTDTAGWSLVSGTFTAAGAERWITIGNFTPKALLTMTAGTGTPANSYVYYYYDDVCVMDIDGIPAGSSATDTSLCGQAVLHFTGRATAAEYLWSNGSTSPGQSITASGVYWVKSFNTDSCLFYIDSFIVSGQTALQQINLGNDTFLCDTATFILNAYDAKFDTYKWSTGDTTASILIADTGTYYVTASSDCYYGSDTLRVSAAPAQLLLPVGIVECNNPTVRIGTSSAGVSYLWNTGDTACCIDVSASGTYVRQSYTVCGDMFTDSVTVSFMDCDFCIMMPNAFSPNGDGLNDAFKPVVNCPLELVHLKIFNRWGELVFDSQGINTAWDGKINGVPAEQGVYFYYLKASSPSGSNEEIIKKGDMTLIR